MIWYVPSFSRFLKFDGSTQPGHEQYLARLNSAKLRRSPSETGRAQLIEEAEKLQEERNEAWKTCKKLREEKEKLEIDLARVRSQLKAGQNGNENEADVVCLVSNEPAPARKRKRAVASRKASS
jgi:hypothetical protein